MKFLIDQSGMIAESDKLLLSQSLFVHKHKLRDQITDAKHKLHPKAELMIKKLYLKTTVLQWKQFGDSLGLTKDNIMEIFLFLNEIGAVTVKHNTKGFVSVIFWRLRNLFRGTLPIRLSRRWQVGFWDICQAVLSAMWPLIALTTITAVGWYGLSSPIKDIATYYFSILIIIWASTVAHEYAHVRIILKEHVQAGILQRGLRIGILHKPLSDKQETKSALMGPLVGLVVASCLTFILYLLTTSKYILLTTGAIVSMMQLVSLLPAYGDGRIIWKHVRGVVR